MNDIDPFTHEFSVAAGTYLGQLATHLNERGYNTEARPSTELAELELPITHNDHYGHLVYSHISDRLGLTRPELSTAIMFLVAQINFVERVLTHLLVPTSMFLFRVKFMTAYHATTALQELERLNGHPDEYELGWLVRDILDERDSAFLLGARQVRNIMAHYELRQAANFLTPDGDPLNDVLAGLCQQEVVSVAAIVQRQLSRISEAFVEVISKTALKDSRSLLGDHT
jgi:hypothetical protein